MSYFSDNRLIQLDDNIVTSYLVRSIDDIFIILNIPFSCVTPHGKNLKNYNNQ